MLSTAGAFRSCESRSGWFALTVFILAGHGLFGQTTTYHLHQEASSTAGLNQLKTGGPDSAVVALQSAQLRNAPPGTYIVKGFDTQAGIPGASGVVPSGSIVTFTLWMKKTADFGTMYPRAELRLNGAGGTMLCAATGSAALTTAIVQYSFSCATGSAVTMTAGDRFYLWAGISMTAGPGNKALNAELDIEGTLNGDYDSRVTVPLPLPAPQIGGLTPDSGEIGTPVGISGSGFGATQGGSTLTFNGRPATPTAWSDTNITAPVPLGATSGPVVVTVNSVPSNGVNFTAIVGTVSGTVSRASDGAYFAGALVEALQSGNVKLSTTSGTDGAYSITGLPTGTYDIRASLSGYATGLSSGANVIAGSTTSINFSLTPGAPISYFYDELGRLTAVVDPSSDSAKYSYDSVGNLLAISRQSAAQTSILEFNPDQGFAGTTVTIFGTGFSSNPSENTLTFNGTTATVTSATTTQIVTSVPSGATSGPIAVTAPSGSAASTEAFTVPSEVTAEITPGGPPVTVTIPTPGQNARVTITGAAAGQQVSLVMGASTISESDISILTPEGTVLAGPQFLPIRGLGYLDTVTLSDSGSYSILVDPRSSHTGSVTLTLYAILDATGTITPGGAPVTLTTTIPGQRGRLTFTGVAGRKVSLFIDGVTIPESDVSIMRPDGGALVSPAFMAITGLFIDATVLPADGTYTILLDPRGTYIGSARFTLYDVVDLAYSITPGDPEATAYIGIPGQNVTWTFTGAAGQRVSQGWNIESEGHFIEGAVDVALIDPIGSTLTSAHIRTVFLDYWWSYGWRYIDVVALPAGGTYTITANPAGTFRGNVYLALHNVPPDATGSVTINGPAANVTLPVPGQNGNLTFDGAEGQQVTVHVTNNTICSPFGLTDPDKGVWVTLRRPDGIAIASAMGCGVPFDLPPQTLTMTGQHTIFVDPDGHPTGAVDVTVTSP